MGLHAYASQAGECLRSVTYGLQVPNGRDAVHDLAKEITFEIGREIHKRVQEAMERAEPTFRREVPWVMGRISGFADGVYVAEDGVRVAVEIKTVGSRAFKGSATWGPRQEHVLQAGLSAKALNCGRVHVVYVNKFAYEGEEALVEWTMDAPWAEIETAQAILERSVELAEQGRVAEAWWQGEVLDRPDRRKVPCSWCHFWDRCQADGPGEGEFSGRTYRPAVQAPG